jgi:hypothetical protein
MAGAAWMKRNCSISIGTAIAKVAGESRLPTKSEHDSQLSDESHTTILSVR